jgi:PPOX class probable F420-dependent enzyme
MTLDQLPRWAFALLEESPVAHLGLIDDRGEPRVLPVTFAVFEGALWSAIDHKPKRTDRPPARLGYLRRHPATALTVDHYDDDWTRLAWVQVLGDTAVLEPLADHRGAVEALRARYPAYGERPPAGPLLRLSPRRVLCWRAQA